IILDDARIFENGDPFAGSADVALAPISPALQQYQMRILPTPGARTFAAPNPPEGAVITYALRSDGAAGDTVARLTITDAAGSVVRTMNGPGRRGVHRVAWDLRYARAEGITDSDDGWFGTPKGPWVLPGTFTVALEARGKKQTQSVEVRSDPRVTVSREAL